MVTFMCVKIKSAKPTTIHIYAALQVMIGYELWEVWSDAAEVDSVVLQLKMRHRLTKRMLIPTKAMQLLAADLGEQTDKVRSLRAVHMCAV
jgi:hypothetical protein